MTAVTLDRSLPRALARWRPLLAWWALSRLVTLLAFLVLDALGPRDHLSASFYRHPFSLLGAWDAVWYDRVAQHGYLLIPGAQSNPAFFPLYPILLRLGNDLFGLPYVATGALLANVSLAVAVIAFYELGCRLLDAGTAMRSACFMAVTPMGYVFSMSYPESLALALSLLALLAALDDRWLAAATLVAVAALARPEAMALVVPLAAIAWAHRASLDPVARGRALGAVFAAPAAVVSYPLYLQWAIHDASAWGSAQTRWGRAFHLSGPWHALVNLPGRAATVPVLGRDAGFLVVYAALLVVAARRGVPPPWIVAGALVLALPLFSGSVESEGRFGLLALPVYWGAGLLVRGRRAELALRIGSLALLVTWVLFLPKLWP